MATEQFSNSAITVLVGGIGAGDPTLVVATAGRFPPIGQFRLIIESEILLVTGVAGTTFTVLRGQEGTTAVPHANGTQVTHIVTAGALAQFKADTFTPGDDLTGSGTSQQVVGIQSVPVDAGAATPAAQYHVLMTRDDGLGGYEYKLAKLTQDMIDPAFAITAFALNMGSLDPFDELPYLEVGQSIGPPDTGALTFSAAYNQSAPYDALKLRDSINLVEEDVLVPAAPVSSYSFLSPALDTQVQFRLRAVKDGFERMAYTTIRWTRRVYYFTADSPGAFPADFTQVWVETNAGSNKPLAVSRNRTFTVTAGATQHVYYLYKDSYGDGTFWVGGFAGGFNLLGTITLTVNGVPDTYRVYESTQVGLGTVTVTVN